MATILLADDDDQWIALIGKELRRARYKVRTARTAARALQLLDGPQKIDLAVIDVFLGGNSSGGDVCRDARELGIPVIAISGIATPRDVGRLFSEHGIVDFVSKASFEIGNFLAQIRRALLKSRSGTDVATQPAGSPNVSVVVNNAIYLNQRANMTAVLKLIRRSSLTDSDKVLAEKHVKEIYSELERKPPDRSKLAKSISWLASRAWEVFLQVLPKLIESASKTASKDTPFSIPV